MIQSTQSRRLVWTAFAAVLAAMAACSDPEADRAAAAKIWALTLQTGDGEVVLPLAAMNVNLVEDLEYAETFEIEGPSVALIGEFPLDVHVDYGEHWERTIGKRIDITGGSSVYVDVPGSSITLPGRGETNVVRGTLVPENVSGQYAGSEGDLTLSGRITLELEGGETLTGTFAVHCVTWG